jgi:uncharacterized membrane protein
LVGIPCNTLRKLSAVTCFKNEQYLTIFNIIQKIRNKNKTYVICIVFDGAIINVSTVWLIKYQTLVRVPFLKKLLAICLENK